MKTYLAGIEIGSRLIVYKHNGRMTSVKVLSIKGDSIHTDGNGLFDRETGASLKKNFRSIQPPFLTEGAYRGA